MVVAVAIYFGVGLGAGFVVCGVLYALGGEMITAEDGDLTPGSEAGLWTTMGGLLILLSVTLLAAYARVDLGHVSFVGVQRAAAIGGVVGAATAPILLWHNRTNRQP